MHQEIKKSALLLLFATLVSAAPPVPRPAPPLRLKTLTGETLSLWALRGKVVVVMFFSTDCGHCHSATKILVPLAEELGPRGLEMLGLATNSKATANLARFAETFQVGFPLAVATRLDWARFGRFPVHSKPPYVPHLLFVDRNGTIRAEFRGEDREFYDNLDQRFRAIIEPLLGEPAPGNRFSE